MSHRRSKISSFYWIFLFPGLLWSSCNHPLDDSGHQAMKHVDHIMHNMPNETLNNADSIDLSTISLPADYSVISSQKTVKPVWSVASIGISANGYVGVDERRDAKISARFNGRIEKLFVRYNFQYVRKGERIMEIYSAELNTVQEELLLLLKDKSEENLIEKVKEKLLLMGLSDSQLEDIESSGKTLNSVNILSPYEGFVYFTNANATAPQISGTQSLQTDGMRMEGNSLPNQAMSASALQIREGSYVSKGQTLFKVNDLKEVSGIILIDNNHSSEISIGSNIELISEQNRDSILKAKISLLEPVLGNGQKFLSARVYLKNESGLLKINSLLTAKISSLKAKQLLIPSSSVLFLGGRIIVWVKAGEAEKGKYIFRARNITTGISQEEGVSVTGGLTDKDEIAQDAGYMIDRENLIKTK